jgi:beta-lactamase class A
MSKSSRVLDLIAQMRERDGLDVGFCAIHLASNERIEFNAHEFFPTASVFKVPLVVEVYRQVDAGRLSLSQRAPLADSQKTLPSGVLVALEEGLSLTVRDLVVLMTIVSDNVATKMLLDLVGIEAINATMDRLELPGINIAIDVHQMFLHAWGLPLDRHVGVAELRETARTKAMDYGSLTFARDRRNTVATAADMTRLMAMIARNEAASGAACSDMISILLQQQYADRVPRYLPSGAVANKTGSMRGLRNDCGLMLRADNDHIAYTLFTFDPTPLAAGNSRLLAERNARVAESMGEIGAELWASFARQDGAQGS